VKYAFADCSWVLGDPGAGRELYLRAHVPGAAHVDLDRDLSDLSIENAGRHPLPGAERFAEAAGRAGIDVGTFVVAYDQGTGAAAARLWWLLRHYGHDACAVMRDGLDAWRGPLASGDERIEPATFVPRERGGDTIDAEGLQERLGDDGLVLVDARAPERYRGDESAGLDPYEGHIAGALNMPYTGAAVPDGVLDAHEIVVYCGSGVSACVDLLELALAGRPDARLYPGSWSDWSRRGLPGERG
jgi:thiosulfate/3-mercaptopyruvate sulfurtransferase